jgi:hypothetical protein
VCTTSSFLQLFQGWHYNGKKIVLVLPEISNKPEDQETTAAETANDSSSTAEKHRESINRTFLHAHRLQSRALQLHGDGCVC